MWKGAGTYEVMVPTVRVRTFSTTCQDERALSVDEKKRCSFCDEPVGWFWLTFDLHSCRMTEEQRYERALAAALDAGDAEHAEQLRARLTKYRRDMREANAGLDGWWTPPTM